MEKRYFSFSWENYEMVNSVSEEYIIRECTIKELFWRLQDGGQNRKGVSELFRKTNSSLR